MSVLEALKGVLKLALMHDGLARGLREASKALDRRQAHMCVLNEACEEEAYKKLVVALCSEHKIPLIKVPDGKQLGEWAGLCKASSKHTRLLAKLTGCIRCAGSRGECPQGCQLLLRRCQGLG
jgi:ribosomal protein L7Ae-like RNA K-turn-binding protein